MAKRRPGLWGEIALALSIITISTVLLNAGVFWLLLKSAEEERRTDLVLSLSEALSGQLEVAHSESGSRGVRRVLSAYRATLSADNRSLCGVEKTPAAVQIL